MTWALVILPRILPWRRSPPPIPTPPLTGVTRIETVPHYRRSCDTGMLSSALTWYSQLDGAGDATEDNISLAPELANVFGGSKR